MNWKILGLLGFSMLAFAADPVTGRSNDPTDGPFMSPTPEELQRAARAAGDVECRVEEKLTGCKAGKAACAPSVFSSRSKTAEDCGKKALKLCRELCEKPKKNPRGKCKCGPVLLGPPPLPTN